jgi:uncharacterized DUF497 family protein
MRSRLHIERLVWGDWNRAHMARHGVTPEDVQEVVAGEPLVRASYKGRFRLLGPNLAQRLLAVFLGPVPDQADVYYVFTARPTSRRERRYYERQGGANPE